MLNILLGIMTSLGIASTPEVDDATARIISDQRTLCDLIKPTGIKEKMDIVETLLKKCDLIKPTEIKEKMDIVKAVLKAQKKIPADHWDNFLALFDILKIGVNTQFHPVHRTIPSYSNSLLDLFITLACIEPTCYDTKEHREELWQRLILFQKPSYKWSHAEKVCILVSKGFEKSILDLDDEALEKFMEHTAIIDTTIRERAISVAENYKKFMDVCMGILENVDGTPGLPIDEDEKNHLRQNAEVIVLTINKSIDKIDQTYVDLVNIVGRGMHLLVLNNVMNTLLRIPPEYRADLKKALEEKKYPELIYEGRPDLSYAERFRTSQLVYNALKEFIAQTYGIHS
jgi:hypothetical protein